jgi:hypothetical protein
MKGVTMKRKMTLMILALLFSSCGRESVPTQLKGYTINPSDVWTTRNIKVCFENGTPATLAYQALVQATVESGLNPFVKVKFYGWGPCTESSGLHIELYGGGPVSYVRSHGTYDGHPRTVGGATHPYGRYLDGKSPGLILNPNFANVRPRLQQIIQRLTPLQLPNLHHTIILHEFGHVLGLEHEHARPDSSCVTEDGARAGGGIEVGLYDPFSIMNPCYAYNHNFFTPLFYSSGDLAALQSLYP